MILCKDKDQIECHKPIEEIEVGDQVWAYDEETGECDWKPVVRLFRNKSKEWVAVKVNGTEIVSTPGHKYYLPQKPKWVSAKDLKKGNVVLLADGTCAVIEAVNYKHYDIPQTTYNFEVEDYHTYFVGDTGVLVHNRSCKILFDERNLQHEYTKHAKDFGISGSWNKTNKQLFKGAILNHIDDSATIALSSTYRSVPTTLYYNPISGIGVHIRLDNYFWTGWKLSLGQLAFNGLT